MVNHIMTYGISVMMFLLTNGIEVYKPLMNMNFEFVWKFFSKNPVPHNLRKGDLVYLPPDRSSSCGTNFLRKPSVGA